MGSGYSRHSPAHVYFISGDETVSAQDLPLARIPYYQLTAWFRHSVELIDVEALACPSARLPEGLLSKPSYLAHRIGRIECIDNVELVVALVCMAEESRRCKFPLYGVAVYWWNDWFHCLFEFLSYPTKLQS